MQEPSLSQEELYRLFSMASRERELQKKGFRAIAGIDEAGRGPLAGPVVAVACILPAKIETIVPGINDSKKVAPPLREKIYQEVTRRKDIFYGVGIVDEKTIDTINILQATLLAMKKAVENLPEIPDFLLFDGKQIPSLSIPSEGIISGDASSVSIATASILAKQIRDHLMEEYDKEWPLYGFKEHKGYGTQKHLEAIEKYGPCRIHRLSFEPLKSRTIC